MASVADTTDMLVQLSRGDQTAAAKLLPLVYDELRAIAARHLANERADHSLQPTALVHEAYMRLADMEKIDWQGKAQFLALAARQIRRVLVDHARKRNAARRGGGRAKVTLDEGVTGLGGFAQAKACGSGTQVDLIDLDDALAELATRSERQSRVVELRYFAGMTIKEVAAVLGVSSPTVNGDWRAARAWLQQYMDR